ncbi:ATP-grasp domain-containing protein [Streptomyces piniterrae]|uniref:ATP-grasp domain-containing protein n=1 Tax=Streptomyces piniterrae TaxID=2571125 RepID=UPI00145DBF5B|nr:ATP-grasp domain-containing protein [Streptomyces piniterrae]
MSDARALVLSSRKPLFEAARARFADEIEFLDLRVADEGDPEVTVPSFDHHRKTLEITDRLMARRPFQHILATSESNLGFAAFLRSRYGLPGMGYDQALVATNKWRMKQRVGKAAFPAPRCWLSGDFAAAGGRLALPAEVVVKPLTGSSCKGVRRIPVDEALSLAAEGTELFLVEEAIDADAELHVDGVVRDGELRVALASVYDRPVLSAVGSTRVSMHLPLDDPRHTPALEAAGRITAALGIPDFVFHLELLETDGTLLFNEIGLRPAGGGIADSLRHFHDVDLWDEYVRLQLEKPSGVRPPLGAGPRDICGVIKVVASAPGSERRIPAAAELLALPGVIRVTQGSPSAETEVRLGSSCGFAQFAFFTLADVRAVRETVANIERLSRLPAS